MLVQVPSVKHRWHFLFVFLRNCLKFKLDYYNTLSELSVRLVHWLAQKSTGLLPSAFRRKRIENCGIAFA